MARNFLRNIAADGPIAEADMPENFLRNNTTGAVYDFGPSRGAPAVALDFARGPYETQKGERGYYAKGDPFSIYNTQGQLIAKLTPPIDPELEKMQQVRLKTLQQQEELKFAQQRNEALKAMGGKPKPPANMRYNAQDQLEVIPGSAPDIARQKMETKNAADYVAALKEQQAHHASTAEVLHNIEQLIGPDDNTPKLHPGFNAAIGPIDQMVKTLIPDTATAESYVKGVKAQAAAAGLGRIRASGGSPGAITEREWPILEQIFANLDPTMDQKEFVKQLMHVRNIVKQSRTNVRDNFKSRFQKDAPDLEAVAPVAPVAPAGGLDPSTQALMQFYLQGG